MGTETQNVSSNDALFGQNAQNPVGQFMNKAIKYGVGVSKVIGSLMEGPSGILPAVEQFGSMVMDKINAGAMNKKHGP